MSNFQFYESRVFAAIFHLIVLGQLFYAMNFEWNLNIPDTPGVPKMLRHGYGGRSRFLTYWCLVRIQIFRLYSIKRKWILARSFFIAERFVAAC